ncbi:MAG: SRPBCC domain-containing protein [Saprospiraceae bacterium]
MIKSRASTVLEKQKTVFINRILNLPLSLVWKAWSDPESFKKWWGPKGFMCPTSLIDFKTGGENFSSMKSADGKEFWSIANYKEIIPFKKIFYEECFVNYKGHEVPPSFYNLPGEWSDVNVTVTFEDLEGKTEMTLHQTGIPIEMYSDCMEGWQSSLDKLEKNLSYPTTSSDN